MEENVFCLVDGLVQEKMSLLVGLQFRKPTVCTARLHVYAQDKKAK